jgi:hypothetical protein
MCHCGHDVNGTLGKGTNTRLIKFDHNLQQKNTQKIRIPMNSPSKLMLLSFTIKFWASGAHFKTSFRAVRAARLDSDDPARSESHRQSRISPGPNMSAARIDIRQKSAKLVSSWSKLDKKCWMFRDRIPGRVHLLTLQDD